MSVLIERVSFSSSLIIQGRIQGQNANLYRLTCLWKVCMYMKLGHGPEGATGLAINQRQMIEWAPSFAICGELSADVHKLSTMVSSKVKEYQNKEAESRTYTDHKYRASIQHTLALTIGHPGGRLLNIAAGQLFNFWVSVLKYGMSPMVEA